MNTILIIGAGFSGTIAAAELLRKNANFPLHIILANGSGRIARGMAYGTQSVDHVLNVPAGNMSAFDAAPHHFEDYARSRDSRIDSSSFVSRRMYGDYLEWLLIQAEQEAPLNVTLQHLYQNVINIAPDSDSAIVTLECGETMRVNKIVLALGHFPSSNPAVADMTFYESDRYIRDPWDATKLDRIDPRDPIILLGTGLTAVDISMTLLNQDPQRTITAVSRRGLLPQHHRPFPQPPATGQAPNVIWGNASTVREQLRGFRRYCRQLALEARDWREGMALLRPLTANIWLTYTEKERKRFLRHVQPYWDTHRHRLAPAVFERFDSARKAGVVRTLAARLRDFDETSTGVIATVQLRGTAKDTNLHAAWVINCTGPCANPYGTGNTLVNQLLQDGHICMDKLGLGLEIGNDCAVINKQDQVSNVVFYIGPWLKANYWEATAVPDLRRFAGALAKRLLDSE